MTGEESRNKGEQKRRAKRSGEERKEVRDEE